MDAPEKTINLKEYLRNVQELESSIYRQEKAIEKIDSYIGRDALYAKQRYDNSLQKYREKIKTLDNIKYCGPTRPDFIPEPKTIEYGSPEHKNQTVSRVLIGFGVGVFLFLLGCSAEAPFFMLTGIAVALISLILLPFMKSKAKKELATLNAQNRKSYEYSLKHAQERFEKEKQNAELEKKNKIALVEKEAEEERLTAEKKYKSEIRGAKERDKISNTEKIKIKKTLTESKKLLEELYSNDLVYPKYRNMAAMCTMYEYIASGRCSELTGPNGAYNLYEMEIRQNIIIVSLVVIVKNLEQIKDNQYQLYKQMQQTNALIYGVGQEMNSIYNTTKSIENIASSIQQNSYVSAECAKITAKNSEALKYISLINAAK